MTTKQSYEKCQNFGNRYGCPTKEEPLMLQLISDINPSLVNRNPKKNDIPDLMILINKTYCNSCKNFMPRQDRT